MKLIIKLITAAALFAGFATAQAAEGLPAEYPLKKCVISDEPLGSMGKPVKVTGPDGTDVYLCCKSCTKKFNKEPEKYTKLVKEAKK
jgi:hypothetical protein